jgi:hypothetical protein
MGKILVVLNLLAALAVGGFLLVDFATRSNWKAAADQAQQEVTASRTTSGTLKITSLEIKSQLDKVTTERDALRKDLEKQKQDYEKKLAKQLDLTSDQEKQATESQVTANVAKAEASRLSKEVKLAQDAVSDRDRTILVLETKSKSLLDRAVSAEQARDSLKQRNEYLLTQLENTNKKLVKLEAGGGIGASVAKTSTAKNPPTVYVRGIITQVLRDRGFVEISLGSDQGVGEGNTMEVYRLKPKPEYLGTIKILDAHHTKAVGRIMKTDDGVRHNPIVKGDEVASKILTR